MTWHDMTWHDARRPLTEHPVAAGHGSLHGGVEGVLVGEAGGAQPHPRHGLAVVEDHPVLPAPAALALPLLTEYKVDI